MNIREIAEWVQDLRQKNLTPSQIASFLVAHGVTITTAEVAFMLTWSRFKSRLDAMQAREAVRKKREADDRRVVVERLKRRQERIAAKRKQRAEAAKRRRLTEQAIKTYERFGCTIDNRGRVRLPKTEAAE